MGDRRESFVGTASLFVEKAGLFAFTEILFVDKASLFLDKEDLFVDKAGLFLDKEDLFVDSDGFFVDKRGLFPHSDGFFFESGVASFVSERSSHPPARTCDRKSRRSLVPSALDEQTRRTWEESSRSSNATRFVFKEIALSPSNLLVSTMNSSARADKTALSTNKTSAGGNKAALSSTNVALSSNKTSEARSLLQVRRRIRPNEGTTRTTRRRSRPSSARSRGHAETSCRGHVVEVFQIQVGHMDTWTHAPAASAFGGIVRACVTTTLP